MDFSTTKDATSPLTVELGQSEDSPFTLGLLLRQAHALVQDTMDEALRPLGIERKHLVVLMRLDAQGAMPQRDLVKWTQHDKATIVRVVDDLERLGLASREPVPGDRRLWAVTLTDEGRRVYRQAGDAAVPAAARSTSALTDMEVEQLQHLLRTLIRN